MIRVIAKNTENKLKKHINANISCFEKDGTFICTIKSKITGRLDFKYTRQDISHDIHNGLSSDELAYTILKQYKKFIQNVFFKNYS